MTKKRHNTRVNPDHTLADFKPAEWVKGYYECKCGEQFPNKRAYENHRHAENVKMFGLIEYTE